MKKEQKLGFILMFITTISWGLEPTLLKSLLDDVPANILIYMRYISTFIIMSVLLVLFKKKYNNTKVTKKNWVLMLGMGVTLTTYYFINIRGLNMTKATIASFIGAATVAIFIAIILSIFYKSEQKELFNKYTLIGLVVALIGTYLATIGGEKITMDMGVILITVSMIFWAIYLAIYKNVDYNISIVRVNRDLYFFALPIFTVILLLTNEFKVLFNLDFLLIIKIIGVTLFVDILTIFTYYPAIRLISGIKCSIITLFCPVIGFIASFIFLGERLTLMQLGGCLLLFASSILLIMKEIIGNKESVKQEQNKILDNDI